jgi:hypothetical protein
MPMVLVLDRLGSLQIVSSCQTCGASCLPMRLYSLLIIPVLAKLTVVIGKNLGSAAGLLKAGLLKSVPQ